LKYGDILHWMARHDRTSFISSMELTYPMATTISISEEMKEKLKNLGRAGDSYEDVIKRMYDITSKSMLLAYLYDESDSVSIDEAIAEARKKWRKSS
jgi:predicted CopG family antitoxin